MASDKEPVMPTGIANDIESPTLPVDKAEQIDLPMLDRSEDANPPPPENESAMPMILTNDGESPTSPGDQAEQDDLPMSDGSEDAILPFPESQIDGATDSSTLKFSENPTSVAIARTQGIAFLRAVLSDPEGAIANEIVKTRGFKGQHASNDRCKNVRNLITGKKEVEDGSVDFVLATWCMLGGGIPATWASPREGNRGGEKLALTEWGEQMLEELQQLLLGKKSDLKHCKAHAKGIVVPGFYDWAEAKEELEAAEKMVAESQKKSNAKAGSSNAGAGKRPPSSPRQSPKTKRQKRSEKNKGVASSKKGDEPDDNDSDTDSDTQIAEFTTGRKGEEPDFEPGKSWRDVGPPEVYRPPRILVPALRSGGLEQMRKDLEDACKDKDHCSRIQVELWNDLVLAAHVNIDECPDKAAEMQTMLVECSKWLPKSKAKGKEIDDVAWRALHSSAFEDAMKQTYLGRCPFCPVEYRFSDDPTLLHGKAHDPQRFQDHQVNLCHDTEQELKIRKRIAGDRLGAKVVATKSGQRGLTFNPLNNIYTKTILVSAHRLISGMKKWNNRLHHLDLVHTIVETADTGNMDKLRAEMLALRVCLQSNIVPPLVTEPTYTLEKVRHEVNTLELPEVRPDGFAPSTVKYNCPPEFDEAKHEPYDNCTYQNNLDSGIQAKEDQRDEARESGEEEIPESDGASADSIRSYRHVLNEVAAFSNPKWLLHSENTDICFPVGCHKTSGRIIVVAYPPRSEDRAFFQTRFDHKLSKKSDEEYLIGFDDIKFHNCFYGRDLEFLDDMANYIHHNNFGRLFQALAWAEGCFQTRFHEKKTGTIIKSPHRHNCDLRFDFDAVLSFEWTEDENVQKRFRTIRESLDVKARFDGSTMNQMVEKYKKLKKKGQWLKKSITEAGPDRIVDGAVFEDKNLGLRATMLGPVEWDNGWTRNLEDGYQFFDYWSTGIKVKELIAEYSEPPFLISSIPVEGERFNDLDKDASIRAWIDHVRNAKMSADGAKPSFIPYHELPHEHIYSWPWVNPLGPSWLERTFVGFFTVYNTVPVHTDGAIVSSTKLLKERTDNRAKHYLTVVEPEGRGHKANPERGNLSPLVSVAVKEMFPKRRSDQTKSVTAAQPEADSSKPAESTAADKEAPKNDGDQAKSATVAKPEATSSKPAEPTGTDNTATENGGDQAKSASHIQSSAATASVGDSNLQEQLKKLQQQLAEKDQEIEELKARNQGPSETSKYLLDTLKAQSQGEHDLSYHLNKALDLKFEENQRLKKKLALALENHPQAQANLEEANAKYDEVKRLEKQVETYRADRDSLQEDLDTTNSELTSAESRIDKLMDKVSDLRSEKRILTKGIGKGWPTVVTSLKAAQGQLNSERMWLRSTTVKQLGAYAMQFGNGLDTPLFDIKEDLVETGSFPNTPAVTESENPFIFGSSRATSRPGSGSLVEENREDNGGPDEENREDNGGPDEENREDNGGPDEESREDNGGPDEENRENSH